MLREETCSWVRGLGVVALDLIRGEMAVLLAAWHLGGQSVFRANWLCPSGSEPLLQIIIDYNE